MVIGARPAMTSAEGGGWSIQAYSARSFGIEVILGCKSWIAGLRRSGGAEALGIWTFESQNGCQSGSQDSSDSREAAPESVLRVTRREGLM